MAVKKNRAVYQFKVTLRNIHPPIWRRIQVWEDTTLAQLHRVLQVAMGWENYHLHEFRIGRKIYAVPDLDDEREITDVKRTRIHDVIQQVGTEFEYVYDLGDYWEHDLLLEAILQPTPDTPYPRCIAGERSCPPEDVDGPGGYEKCLLSRICGLTPVREVVPACDKGPFPSRCRYGIRTIFWSPLEFCC